MPWTFSSLSMVWASWSMACWHLKRSRNRSWRRWGLQVYALISGLAKVSGPKEEGMSHIVCLCGYPENIMRVKCHQTCSVLWLPVYLLPLKQICRQPMSDCQIVIRLQKNKSSLIISSNPQTYNCFLSNPSWRKAEGNCSLETIKQKVPVLGFVKKS